MWFLPEERCLKRHNREEQDEFLEVGTRIKNQELLNLDSSKNQESLKVQEFPQSRIKNFFPSFLISSKNQERGNQNSWGQAGVGTWISGRDNKFKQELRCYKRTLFP